MVSHLRELRDSDPSHSVSPSISLLSNGTRTPLLSPLLSGWTLGLVFKSFHLCFNRAGSACATYFVMLHLRGGGLSCAR